MTSKQEEPYNFSSICNHYLVTMNANEHITFCNSNFSNKFYNDPVTSTITSLIQEEYVHSFKNHFKVCIATPGKCIQGTSVLINQLDGPHHIKWEMVAEVQKSRDVNVYLVGHDLHKNLHGDSGVDLSLKILKAIFDSIDAVKFFISPNLRIQFFNNPAFEKYLKLHGKRMKIGDNILEYVRDTENKIEQDFLIDFDKAVKGETVISEKEIKYKHDKSKCFRTKYYPVYEEGNLIGVSVTVSDVTERTRYEDNIRLQNEKLRKIAFIQSHQVRQPLSNILGILSLVNTDGMSEDDKYLMKILNLSAQQLDQVVRKIVIEAQQLELYSEFFELHTPMQNS